MSADFKGVKDTQTGVTIWPTLYKKNSSGGGQQWIIGVRDTTIFTQWGQTAPGSKIQESSDTIKEGKNIGRANETTAEEQALAEAQSQWEKKLKKGYVTSLDDAQSGKVDSIIEGGIFPMLAHRYDEQAEKIVYPAFAQPKLDGHRMTAQRNRNEWTLWSRTRKLINGLPHICAELLSIQGRLTLGDRPDGEGYNHDYHDRFEELSSFLRSDEPKAGCEVVQMHLYDIAGEGTFRERNERLKQAITPDLKYLKYVETIEVANEDELMVAFEKFRGLGYEGAIVRNAHGLYVNKRSYDLQKVKEFDDAEFEVTGVVEGRGKLAGHGIFVCKTKDGATFEAKMVGALSELKKFYENPKLAVGRMLTVKYQGFTTKSKVPRFPVALRFREEL